MRLRVGYELRYHFPQITPIIMMLNVHYTRVSDLERPDHIVISPSVPISGYPAASGTGAAGFSPQPERCAFQPTLS